MSDFLSLSLTQCLVGAVGVWLIWAGAYGAAQVIGWYAERNEISALEIASFVVSALACWGCAIAFWGLAGRAGFLIVTRAL